MELNLRKALETNGASLDEKQITFVEGLEVALRSALENKDNKLSEVVAKHVKEANLGTNDELSEQLRGLAEKVDAVQKNSEIRLTPNQKRTLRTEFDQNRDAIVDAIRNKKSLGSEKEAIFNVRAAALPHYNTNTVSLGTATGVLIENYDDSSEIAKIRYPENFILNTIRNRQVELVPNTRMIREQASTDGAVTIVAEAGQKPLVKYKFVKNAISRKKYAGRIEWSEEFEMDNEMLFDAIVKMIEEDVIRVWNNGLIADIIANATSYSSSSSTALVPVPNATDVAIVLQGLIAAQNYEADTVVINPQTLVALLLMKKLDGEYINNPVFVDGKLNGMNVIVSAQVTAGYILVFDSSIYSEVHSDIITRVGTYDKQFITNEFTLIAEVFSLLSVAVIDKVASYYGAIATIAGDIELPAAS